MRLLILLNILLSFWTTFNETGTKNHIKARAEAAYQNKDYNNAIIQYRKLIEKYKVNDEKVILNIAHAYFSIKDTAIARYYYQKITHSKSPDISSVANLQLGILEAYKENYETALKYFKESLKYYSENEEARYNYELLQKLIEKEESTNIEKNKKGKDKEQQETAENNNNSTISTPSIEGEENEEQTQLEESSNATKRLNISGKGIFSLFKQKKEDQKSERIPEQKGNKESDIMVSNRLKRYYLSEAKAKALLEAMKEEEIQYIQQQKKYQETDYSKDKPDY